MTTNEPRNSLRRYLLGMSTAEQRAAIEVEYFGSPDALDRVCEEEDDLIDDYLSGGLASDEHKAFESHYLAAPHHRMRVAVSGRLRAAAARRSNPLVPSRNWPFPKRGSLGPILGWALAASLIAITGAYLLTENWRLRREAGETQAARADLIRQNENLQGQLQKERSAIAGAQEELSRLSDALSQVRPALASFLLIPQTRGAGQITAVSLPPGSDQLALRLRLESDDFPEYHVALKDPATGQIVWRSNALTAVAEGSAKAVVIQIPTALLKPQNYALDLAGKPARGPAEVMTSYPFRLVLQ